MSNTEKSYIIDNIIQSLGNCRGSRFESRGRESKVEIQGSKVENTKFLSILKVLQPLNAAKQINN
jgi:hypothetical protein